MKLTLIDYKTGPSISREFVWVNPANNDKLSPTFNNEHSAILWHSVMQSYFCPTKNCSARSFEKI